jgi:osmotically-inducible protein OsmY
LQLAQFSSRDHCYLVTPTTNTSDLDIQATISNELLHTSSVGTNVRVEVSGGTVTLSGEVGSLPERIAATGAAMRVSGVKAVADEMRVRTSGSAGANDIDIARTASQLLRRAVDVPSDTVRVEVHNHVITLSGQVMWFYQRDAAAVAVTNIKGVTAMANTITVHLGAPVSVMKDSVDQAL